jgi:predicted lipoprotein
MTPSKAIQAAAVGLAVVSGLVIMSTGARPAAAVPMRKSHATMVQDAIDGFIVPRIEMFSKSAGTLSDAVGQVCERHGEDASIEAARDVYAETVRAWAGLDFIRFGPVTREHRLERIFFWPDPKGFASRQLNGLLAAKKPELVAPGGLVGQSVAVQGLPALEILLFNQKTALGTGTDEAAQYRCALAHAIAANIKAIADEIGAGWAGPDGYRMKMLTPGSDNPLYRDASETVREVVKSMAMGVELARDRFILPELTAVTANPPRRVRLAFEGSNLTGTYLAAAIAAQKELFDNLGLAAYVPADKPWMVDFLPNAWKSLESDVKKLDALRAKERGSEAHLHALRKMRFDLSGIRQIVFKELAPNADVDMGINELDGD